jgi:hypothetical protein
MVFNVSVSDNINPDKMSKHYFFHGLWAARSFVDC